MALGALSTGFVSAVPVMRDVLSMGPNAAAGLSQNTIFFGILLTTIVHGLIINLTVLFGVCPFWWLLTAGRDKSEVATTMDEIERERDQKLAALSGGAYEDPFSKL